MSGDTTSQLERTHRETEPDIIPGSAGEPPAVGSGEVEQQPGRRRRRLLAILSLLGVALLCLVVVFAVQVRQHRQLENDREQALNAARQTAINLTTITSANLDDATKRLIDNATPEFKTEATKVIGGLGEVLRENEIDSQGEIKDAGLVRIDPSTATALVAVDATVKNVAVPEGRVNPTTLRVSLQKIDGRWLTADLEIFG